MRSFFNLEKEALKQLEFNPFFKFEVAPGTKSVGLVRGVSQKRPEEVPLQFQKISKELQKKA